MVEVLIIVDAVLYSKYGWLSFLTPLISFFLSFCFDLFLFLCLSIYPSHIHTLSLILNSSRTRISPQTYGGFLLHTCVSAEETETLTALTVGSKVEAKVDYARRRYVRVRTDIILYACIPHFFLSRPEIFPHFLPLISVCIPFSFHHSTHFCVCSFLLFSPFIYIFDNI